MPQSWNRYAYVLNNPLVYIDPNGTDFVHKTENGIEQYKWATGEELESLRKSGWADVTYDENGSFTFSVVDGSGQRTGEIYELHSDGSHNWFSRLVSPAEFNQILANEAFKEDIAKSISAFAFATFFAPLIEGILGSSLAEEGIATNSAALADDAIVIRRRSESTGKLRERCRARRQCWTPLRRFCQQRLWAYN